MEKSSTDKLTQRESTYQHSLLKKLKKIPQSWWVVKEAKSIRGIPDILGCIKGKFIALEVKKNERDAQVLIGRAVLQRHTLDKIAESGGFADFVYPQNEREIIARLLEL